MPNKVKRDLLLVECFLRGFNQTFKESYTIDVSPEEVERNKPAVEAVASNREGIRLAIEHTLLQPFEGQKADDPRFLAVFGKLHEDPSLVVPGRLIELHAPVGVIPNGIDWNFLAAKIREWFQCERLKFADGESIHKVSGLEFDLEITVQTMDIPETPGVLSVGRILPRDRSFEDVIRKALNDKLAKLAGTPADRHFLVFEYAVPVGGYVRIAQAVDSMRGGFPDLARLEAIWVANTVVWDTKNIVWFLHIWPDGVGQRFKVLAGRVTT